ncbi:MAG TPA: prepilin-type N-terminal cleavage/methylation domain-containing protein [Verrucomicrobiae bacterium]
MKPRFSNQRSHALTLVEVLVVIVVVAFLAAMFLPALVNVHHTRMPLNCVNNLKEVELSFRIWAGDNNDKYPMEIS